MQIVYDKFSIYEDSLAKAIGPFLTLGGVLGKNGIRQTGRSASSSKIRHSPAGAKRHIHVQSVGELNGIHRIDPSTGLLHLKMPMVGDKFIPLYAFKALTKMAIAIMPNDVLFKFKRVLEWLQNTNDNSILGSPKVGFSYSYVGNAPPTLGGVLLQRTEPDAPVPYIVFLFVAGSVCFQIQIFSDNHDLHVPKDQNLGIVWTSQLPTPEGGWHPIEYSTPTQFDWSSASPVLQPVKEFELAFNPLTAEGKFTPIFREP